MTSTDNHCRNDNLPITNDLFYLTRTMTMDIKSKSSQQITKEVDSIHNEIQPALYENNPESKELFDLSDRSEEELNDKILEITVRIKKEYPELSKYIEEMPVTIPTESDPKINIKNLKAYYDSLNSMLVKYIWQTLQAK